MNRYFMKGTQVATKNIKKTERKKKNCQGKTLFLTQLFFKNEGEINLSQIYKGQGFCYHWNSSPRHAKGSLLN